MNIGVMAYIRYLCLLEHSGVQYILTTWVTWRVYYKWQEMLVLHGCLRLPLVFDGVRVAHLFSFQLCGVFSVLFVFVPCLVCSVLSFSELSIFSFFSNIYCKQGEIWKLTRYLLQKSQSVNLLTVIKWETNIPNCRRNFKIQGKNRAVVVVIAW